MKFDFVIGNPPYQDETVGEQKTFAPPVYHLFIDEAYKVSDKVELIHPARFLFNAGGTPKPWNKKMLEDPHLKVLYHEQKSGNIFPNTTIEGGIAITYRDAKKNFGAIRMFTPFPELKGILHKVVDSANFSSLSGHIYRQNKFDLATLYADRPECKKMVGSGGKEKRLTTSIFETLPTLFEAERASDDEIKILGLIKNKRVYRFVKRKYILDSENLFNLFKWKVLVPKSNGTGAIGEVLSTPLIGEPLIGEPLIGYTQSFIGIGKFETEFEAQACLKYVKTKFARAMLGVLKVTQHNPAPKWKYVPLQNFTKKSDIDWSQPVADIDKQLYKKYGLSEEEINFIESRVKEMA